MSRGLDSTRGSHGPGASAASAMKCWARRYTRASCAATAPTARPVCGTTCWSKVKPVVCTASSDSCESRHYEPGPDDWTAQGPGHAQRGGRQRAGPPVPGRWTEPEVGSRLHLHLDSRGLAARGGGAGPVLAAHRGLVDAGEHDLAARGGCADDGSVASRQAGGLVAPLGPGQPVYQRALPEAAG